MHQGPGFWICALNFCKIWIEKLKIGTKQIDRPNVFWLEILGDHYFATCSIFGSSYWRCYIYKTVYKLFGQFSFTWMVSIGLYRVAYTLYHKVIAFSTTSTHEESLNWMEKFLLGSQEGATPNRWRARRLCLSRSAKSFIVRSQCSMFCFNSFTLKIVPWILGSTVFTNQNND